MSEGRQAPPWMAADIMNRFNAWFDSSSAMRHPAEIECDELRIQIGELERSIEADRVYVAALRDRLAIVDSAWAETERAISLQIDRALVLAAMENPLHSVSFDPPKRWWTKGCGK